MSDGADVCMYIRAHVCACGYHTQVQGKYDVMDARSGKKTSEEDVSARTDETRPPSPGSFDIDAEHKRLTERFEAELERYTIKPVPRPAQENGGDGHGR